jgi:hypothetical protein
MMIVRAFFVLGLTLVGCGPVPVDESGFPHEHCLPSEYSQTRCVNGDLELCEPSVLTCAPGESDGMGSCTVNRPERFETDVWVRIDSCPVP